MKHSTINGYGKVVMTFVLILQGIATQAQEKITIDTGEARSWLSENWMWVAGVVLLLIVLLAAGNPRKRTTTTVRDNLSGSTTTTTTVEEE